MIQSNNSTAFSRLISGMMVHLIVSVCLMALPSVSSAQKIAFVASEAIFDKLPEAKNARAKLTELQSGWMREISRMESELTKLKSEQEKNRLLWSSQEKRDAESQLADLQSKLAAYRSAKLGPDGEYEKTYKDLMGPVLDKVFKAVNEEMKAQKFDIILDKSSRGNLILSANPTYDLTVQVLRRLGVTLDSADTPVPPGSGKTPDSGTSPRSGAVPPPGEGTITPDDAMRRPTDKKPAVPLDTTPPK